MNELIDIMTWERQGEFTRCGRCNHNFIITACGVYKSELRILTEGDSVSASIKVDSKTNSISATPLILFLKASGETELYSTWLLPATIRRTAFKLATGSIETLAVDTTYYVIIFN